MNSVKFGIVELNWNMLFQLINTAIMLLIIGAGIYGLVLLVKASKRVGRVSEVYLKENSEKNKPE